MATSGAMSTSNQYIKYTISITQNSRSVANNTSSVTVKVRFYRTNTGYTTYGTGTVYCTINGNKYEAAVKPSHKITESGIVLFNKTVTVKHNSDGTKRLTCSAYISHERVTSSNQSYSQTLTSIPRASSFGTITGNMIGGSMTVNINRNSSSFTHGLWYKVGNSGWQVVAESGIGTSKTFTINMSMCSQLPNATSGTLTLLLKTFNGSTQLAAGINKTVTVYVPSSVTPSLGITVADANGYANTYGGYLANLSKVKVTLKATTAYGANISTYNTNVEGVNYSGSSITSNILKNTGSLKITSKVTDKRNRSKEASQTINVIAYNFPQIRSFSAVRCNSDGSLNDTGDYIKATFSYTVTAISNKNSVTAVLKYKQSSASSYTTKTFTELATTYTGNNISYIFQADGGFAYDVELSLGDKFRTITYKRDVSTAFTLLHFHNSGRGLGIGRMSSGSGSMDIGLNANFDKDSTFDGAVYGNAYGMSILPQIPENANLNNYTTPGCYCCPWNAKAATIRNIPPSAGIAFRLNVYNSTGGGTVTDYTYLRQEYITYSNTFGRFERYGYKQGGAWVWESWVQTTLSPSASQFVYGAHNYQPKHNPHTLWSGALYMSAGHTISFAESEYVSKQPHGIVLVFSRYYDKAPQNHNWQSFFVSKEYVKKHSGNGMTFTMFTSSFMTAATKYLYVKNDGIAGNDINREKKTNSGITYNNEDYVLRYVIGT